MPILSFKLLTEITSDDVGTSYLRESSFGGTLLDKYCLLMLSPSIFAIPRKVKLSMQILMTLDN